MTFVLNFAWFDQRQRGRAPDLRRTGVVEDTPSSLRGRRPAGDGAVAAAAGGGGGGLLGRGGARRAQAIRGRVRQSHRDDDL